MNVNIWQIYFRPEQFEQLDPCFTPLDNSAQQNESREFQVFSRLQATSQANQFSHWGALSWKFNQKTGWLGQRLLDAVKQAPEVDVFYMNPYPHNEALHVSPWWQGEVAHPDFLMVSESFLRAAGLDESLCHRLTPGHEYSLCNYLIGSPLFWSRYLDFVRNALNMAEQQMPIDLRLKMHSADADWKGIHYQSTYVPFIVERFFGLFMRSETGKGLNAKQLPSPLGEAGMDAQLEELREIKRVAWLTQSAKVLEEWQTKRKIFFTSRYGTGWCGMYLERVMSARVYF